MANKIDLNTIAKEYAEGRISKEDFLYLHKMLTNPSSKNKSPVQQPPVLKPARPVKATAQQQARQPVQRQAAPNQQAQRQRRAIHPQASSPNIVKPQGFENLRVPPPFPVEKQKASFFGYVRRHHKEVVALLGTTGIFISMFYNNFHTPAVDSGNARVVVIQSQQDRVTPGLRTQDIKLIAELMMEDNSWNKGLIDDFLVQWGRLSDNEKQEIKQAEWYNAFSAMLSQQIKIAQTKAKTGDVSAIYNQQALLLLADNLVFGNNKEAQQALAKLASSNSKRSSLDTENNEAPESSIPESVEKIERIQTAKITEKPTTPKSTVPERSRRDTNESKPHRISRQEIEDVINQFTVAFEAGQTQDLMSLFPDDDYSSSFTALNRVKKEYKELLRTSQDRRLDLNSFFWEHDYDEARGTARYKANILKNDKNAKETVTANLDITLRRLLGKVYITEFKLSNRETVAYTTKSTPVATKNVKSVKNSNSANKVVSIKEKPKHPTPAELQDLVTQYITAYETGDVKELMNLFANATWTSSQSGLVEMQQSYKNLFKTTSGREIFVKNINWNFKDKKALGTGDLTLTYHTNDEKIISQKGKIRIVATRQGDTVQFTQMFHIVE